MDIWKKIKDMLRYISNNIGYITKIFNINPTHISKRKKTIRKQKLNGVKWS